MLPISSSLPLKTGDIIFIAIPNVLYRKVAQITGSPATHVGIVFDDPHHGWVVAESAVPLVKYTPLAKFLARSDRGWFAIRRLKGGLTPAQCEHLRKACDAKMGTLYHLGFRFESKRQFCSKLVYEAYLAATGIEVGRLESFRQLLARHPDTPIGFWRAWFLGAIPWSRLTVTPASQMTSDALETVIEQTQAEP
ncbi:MAG: hypothetical protein KGZ80_05595 [Methylomonas sp.]|nr:hypothetical protein [Methylomonas sp.]PPD20714.1 MAG: hypothetical protein CTY23_07815 [Methylomonas sp.]PPD25048.1 MAG: hypothetical protein CTY22_09825 [Methylomonas sp.]PPD34363.1 MAG: hypothetical protein CTY21_09855 [Methylomonas sp.]PPD38964.1 MAG: hypothetical protein CTY17_08705 [Methylomonas sp.]